MASTEWETPQAFFDTLDAEFGFTVDVCATTENAKCKRYLTKQDDALDRDWSSEIAWMNPPYDKSVKKWIRKAYREAQKGATVVCLIQARSADTEMWHRWVMKASEWRFVRGRLYFLKNKVPGIRPNISSVVVVFRPFCQGPPTVSAIDNKGGPAVAPA